MRQSVKYANWTKTREEWYKKECDEILYRTKSKIIFEDNEAFIVAENQKNYLVTVDNPKSIWFQVWLKIREGR